MTTTVPFAPEAVMAQAGAENFPVASRLAGRGPAAHLRAIYGYARLVDDLGDAAPGDRSALLDHVESQIDAIYAGEEVEHPLLRRLSETIHACRLPAGPFRRLVQANRRDQVVSRYETFEELLEYCQLSAAPVGELVLHVFGQATPRRVALSDRICAGLQVVEHLQDVREDHAMGRVYLPQEDLRRFGCAETELGERLTSPALRQVVAFEAQRTRGLFAEGAPLVAELSPRPRLCVAGFLAGGRSALRALERGGYDVACGPARRPRWMFAVALPGALIGR